MIHFLYKMKHSSSTHWSLTGEKPCCLAHHGHLLNVHPLDLSTQDKCSHPLKHGHSDEESWIWRHFLPSPSLGLNTVSQTQRASLDAAPPLAGGCLRRQQDPGSHCHACPVGYVRYISLVITVPLHSTLHISNRPQTDM